PGAEGSQPVFAFCPNYGYDAGRVGCSSACGADLGACASMNWAAQISPTGRSTAAVWSPSPDTAFVVGFEGLLLRYRNGGITAYEWNPDDEWRSVWGSSETDVWAVGRTLGPNDGIIAHFDGSTWQTALVS